MFSLIFLSSMALWFAILKFAGVIDFLWCFQINLIIADIDLLT